MKLLKLFFVMLLFFCFSFDSVEARVSGIFIRDEGEGYQCSHIGEWNQETKTCKLSDDVTGHNIMLSDEVTLDGNGHQVIGDLDGANIGINISSDNVTVKNLRVKNFFYGIRISNFDGIKIEGCEVSSDEDKRGFGIEISKSDSVRVSDSSVSNMHTGFNLSNSNNAQLRNNYFFDNVRDFEVSGHYYNDIDATNRLSGEGPIRYFVNESGKTYDGIDAGVVYCVNCNEVVFENINIENNGNGLVLYNTANSVVRNSNFSGLNGIVLINSWDNEIYGNNVSGQYNGIDLIYSKAVNNSISRNNIFNSGKGVGIFQHAKSNWIFNNNFYDNIIDAYDQYGDNFFNKDLPEGGNHWSNFDEASEGCTDENEDNVCDFSYQIGSNVKDMYPWVNEFEIEKTGNSNILFIPGIQASRLYKKHNLDEDQLWEPTNHNEDVKDLYLNEDGESIDSGVYTRDVMSKAYGMFGIYGGFMDFMDEMKSESVINDWEALPYDWRYSPERIIEDGIVMEDGKIVDPVEKLEELAENSKNKKVTIISHSNGGIFAKLLVSELRKRGEEDLVERIIFVATPQAGTPKTIAGLLHGDGLQLAHGIFFDKEIARGFGENMSSAYNLLPSKKYFDMIATPVIEFGSNVDDIYDFKNIYGEKIDNYAEMKSFLLGDDGKRKDPDFSDIDSPNVLSKYLFGETENIHDEIDNWSPGSIEVIQIAGWGLDTIAGIKYEGCKSSFSCNDLSDLDRDLVITMDGDETVVYPSAIMMGDAERYYFDLELYNIEKDKFSFTINHASILETEIIQELVGNLILGNDELPEYISTERPESSPDDKRLRLKMKSPVDIHLFDENGNHTGFIENTNTDSDIEMFETEIPNSYYWEFGEKKYLGIGADGNFEVELQGTDTGTFTFEIEEVSGNDEIVSSKAFENIPVFEGMKANLEISDGNVDEMKVDIDSDGVIDFSIDSNGDTMEVSVAILEKILNDLNCHKSIKRPLTQRMIQVKRLIGQGKTKPAKNLLEAMTNHLDAVKKRNNLDRLGISEEEIVSVMEIIEKVNLSI